MFKSDWSVGVDKIVITAALTIIQAAKYHIIVL